ncbi:MULTISPECIES: DUF4421 family protein [unclassified Chryseobacterium]|uniref:DUF4421 family protein n=1 Tax=unclassified Chryseobacterium TaxID=2593645 RepID=UPI00226A0757|nr:MULTISPECIES: DUF4421 family protein [unclassified Chryseobacterium]
MKTKLLSIIFLVFSLISYSQDVNEDSVKIKKYVEDDKNKISLIAGLSYIDDSLGLLYEDKVFRLRPNDAFYTEFFLRYRWIDVTFSFAPKLTKINRDDAEKGKTKYFNLGFSFFVAPKIRQFLYYSEVKGLYFQDTRDFMRLLYGSDYNEEGYLQFPDAKYRSYRGETSYLWLGNKVDYRSFTNMTYKPLKDVFVVSTGLFYQYNTLSDTNRAIYQDANFNDDDVDNSKSKDFRIALRTGGGVQKTIKGNWYVIAEAYPEAYYSKLIDEDDLHEFNIGFYSNARVGYDSGKWFFGGGAQLNWVNSSNENFYSSTQWLFRIGIGFRFTAPKLMNKNFDKIDKALNF